MKQSSLEKRVEMIQNIREISANNEKTMNNIHNIMNNSTPIDQSAQGSKSKFKYRMLIAIVLFGIYALSSSNHLEYKGFNTGKIDKIIAQNFDVEEVFKQMNIKLTDTIE